MKNIKLVAMIIAVSAILPVFAGYIDKDGNYVPNPAFGKPSAEETYRPAVEPETVDKTYRPAVEPESKMEKIKTPQEREEAQTVDEDRISKKYAPRYK